MATKNLIDNSSTTVSASTPGYTVDLRYHTTLRLASVGVPVRLKVSANSTSSSDTGAVLLLDSTGSVMLTCLINGPSGDNWYWTNGYLPATLAKYDLHFQQPATGTLTVYSADVYEIDWTTDPILGEAPALALGALTTTADGISIDSGAVDATLGALTIAADGVVVANPPAYQAVGTSAGGTGTLSPAWPTHAVDDIAILLVSAYKIGADPGAATLSTSAGFVAITGASDLTTTGANNNRVTAFWCRATSTSMATPTVADAHDLANSVIITVRGCVNSGNPYDVVTTSTNTTSNTSVSVTGGTTTVANTLLLAAIGHGETSATASAWTNASLTSITERVDDHNSAHVAAATGVMATAAAYNATTATLSLASSWAGITVALKP